MDVDDLTFDGSRSAGLPAGAWHVVPQRSTATFSVRDKLVTTVHGSMPIEEGVVVRSADGSVSQGWVRVSVAGIDTGNARRDKDLRKARFLDAATHPGIVVEVDEVVVTPTGGTARAVLRARGATAPLELSAETVSVSRHEVRLRVTGRLDRGPLGIKVPAFVVGRFVDVSAELTFRRPPSDAV